MSGETQYEKLLDPNKPISHSLLHMSLTSLYSDKLKYTGARNTFKFDNIVLFYVKLQGQLTFIEEKKGSVNEDNTLIFQLHDEEGKTCRVLISKLKIDMRSFDSKRFYHVFGRLDRIFDSTTISNSPLTFDFIRASHIVPVESDLDRIRFHKQCRKNQLYIAKRSIEVAKITMAHVKELTEKEIEENLLKTTSSHLIITSKDGTKKLQYLGNGGNKVKNPRKRQFQSSTKKPKTKKLVKKIK